MAKPCCSPLDHKQSHRRVAAQTPNTPPLLAEQGTATALPLQLSPLWSALLDKIC